MLFKKFIPIMVALPLCGPSLTAAAERPNIIFVVADDMGARDTGYSGNPVAKTPHLDQMAAEGLRLDSFYSAHATCSPGRMAIMTGRTPLRARMVTTVGAMQEGEVTLAAALKTIGYETAHFGKWGLGREGTHPNKVGFDFAVWNRGYFDNNPRFHLDQSDKKDEWPIHREGESSIVAVDLALEYIKPRAEKKQPFFVQICFGSPHAPHQPHEDFAKLYEALPEKERNYYGEVSGLDAAVGKLRQALRDMNIADNTLLWFVSDNGGILKQYRVDYKGNLGALTIGLLEWPRKIPKPMRSDIPTCHIDMYPTVLDITGVTLEHQPVIDGVSLLPLFEGRMEARPKPLGFTSGTFVGGDDSDACELRRGVWIDGRYMLRVEPPHKSRREEVVSLYDLAADPAQEKDLAGAEPERVRKMRADLEAWRKTVQASFAGKDYIR